jgi:TctA family transporter
VTAIASFVVCPLIPAVVALVLASSATRNIRASGGMKTGEGLVQASRWVAWINIALSVLFVVLIVIVAAAGGFDDENTFESLARLGWPGGWSGGWQ